jgi:tetratricopeptide (TPR) repeat protein
LTQNRSRTITPDFASPEQVRGDPITTASDVYSLGLILYVLMTGRRPYRLSGATANQIFQTVCVTEPEKPSSALIRSQAGAPTDTKDSAPVERMQSDLKRKKLARSIAGDLDNIVLKALRKEPERRYTTVAQLSEDVRRHMEHLPVIARKGTTRYIASRFLARHRAGVTASGVVAAILILGVVMIVREAYLADKRFRDVRRLANSLIFEIHDSIKHLPGSTPARKLIVERATEYLDSLSKESRDDLSLQRELASAYERVGQVQGQYLQDSLGDVTGSLATFKKSFAIRQQIGARTGDYADRLALAQAYRFVANQQWALGDIPHARENIDSAVMISEELNRSRPDQWDTLDELGSEYSLVNKIEASTFAWTDNDVTKRSAYLRKAMEIDEAMLRVRPQDLGALHAYSHDLSSMAYEVRSKDLQQALKYREQALSIDQKLHSQSAEVRYARSLAIDYEEIGDVYDRVGDHVRALDNDSRSLEIMKGLMSVDPKNVTVRQSAAISYSNVASQLRELGRYPESIDDIRIALELERGVLTSDPGSQVGRGMMATIATESAVTYLEAGRPSDALREFDEGCSIFESLYQSRPGDWSLKAKVAMCNVRRGDSAQRAGNITQAGEYYHRALLQIEPSLRESEIPNAMWAAAAYLYAGLGDLSLGHARQPNQEAEKRRQNWKDAQSSYTKSLAAWKNVKDLESSAVKNLVGTRHKDESNVSKHLQACNAALTR